jgi:hypothetical protein
MTLMKKFDEEIAVVRGEMKGDLQVLRELPLSDQIPHDFALDFSSPVNTATHLGNPKR